MELFGKKKADFILSFILRGSLFHFSRKDFGKKTDIIFERQKEWMRRRRKETNLETRNFHCRRKEEEAIERVGN